MVATPTKSRLYRTERNLTRTLRVAYPSGRGRMVLRTEKDWEQSIEPVAVSEDGNVSTFELEADQPFLYFKPCLVESGATHWAVGPNKLLLMTEKDARVSYPYFFSPDVGRFSPLVELPSKILGRDHRIRGYLPPGYDENTLSRFPVVYMQDGQNLFFPDEAFQGHDWEVEQTGDVLRTMSAVEDFLILGIYSGDRMTEYTKPGYERYGRVAGGGGGAGAREARNPRGTPPPVPLGLGLVPGRRRLVLHGLAAPRGLRQRRLHVEHLLPPGRPHRPRVRGAVPGRRLLPRQRLAGRQLRGHRGDGHGAHLARLGVRAQPACTCASPWPATARRPGGRGCTCPCSS